MVYSTGISQTLRSRWANLKKWKKPTSDKQSKNCRVDTCDPPGTRDNHNGFNLSPIVLVTREKYSPSKSKGSQIEALVRCPKCNLISDSLTKIKKHMNAAHPENENKNPVKTSSLENKAKNSILATEAKNPGKIECLKCKESFQSVARLILHKYIHGTQGHKKMNEVCLLCKQRFPDLAEHHRLIHHSAAARSQG